MHQSIRNVNTGQIFNIIGACDGQILIAFLTVNLSSSGCNLRSCQLWKFFCFQYLFTYGTFFVLAADCCSGWLFVDDPVAGGVWLYFAFCSAFTQVPVACGIGLPFSAELVRVLQLWNGFVVGISTSFAGIGFVSLKVQFSSYW